MAALPDHLPRGDPTLPLRRIACLVVIVFALLPLLTGRALAQAPKISPGIIFIADGAGGSALASDNLRHAVVAARIPLQVIQFRWSSGEAVQDLTNQEYHRVQGTALAHQVLAYRQAYPGQRIYLLSHSSGDSIVLTAAGLLPPDSIERIFLMAPTVSTGYNLRPALQTTKGGIDVYTSTNDGVLATFIPQFGTGDGLVAKAAGQVGFSRAAVGPEDGALYSKLRQHAWNSRMGVTTSTEGTHYWAVREWYLQRFVLPIIITSSYQGGRYP